MTLCRLRLLALCAAGFTPMFCYGLGIRIPDQNAEATARGDAFAATANNPSAIYYNPAGISQLDGFQAIAGLYSITMNSRIDLKADGDPFDNKYDLQHVPQFFATWKPRNSPVTFGIGAYAPYGLGISYDDEVPFRTLARSGSIQYYCINPVISWQICDQLSIAAGPTFNLGSARIARGVIAPGDEFRFRGDAFSVGFNAGLLWTPHRMHRFGLSYRSQTSLNFDGTSHLEYDDVVVPVQVAPGVTLPIKVADGVDRTEHASARFRFPQHIVFGYSFQPTPDWNFEADLDWTDWDQLDTVTLRQHSGNVALPFNWQSSFMYEFGVTRRIRDWRISAGYIYSENSVPNESFSPAVPDSNRHVISVGLGQDLKHWRWDVAYQYSCGPKRTIAQGSLADGSYRFEGHALTFSLGCRF